MADRWTLYTAFAHKKNDIHSNAIMCTCAFQHLASTKFHWVAIVAVCMQPAFLPIWPCMLVTHMNCCRTLHCTHAWLSLTAVGAHTHRWLPAFLEAACAYTVVLLSQLCSVTLVLYYVIPMLCPLGSCAHTDNTTQHTTPLCVLFYIPVGLTAIRCPWISQNLNCSLHCWPVIAHWGKTVKCVIDKTRQATSNIHIVENCQHACCGSCVLSGMRCATMRDAEAFPEFCEKPAFKHQMVLVLHSARVA